MATFWEIAARSLGHMFLLSFVYLYVLFISHFGFKSGIWLLIAPVPVHCFSNTFFFQTLGRIQRTLSGLAKTVKLQFSWEFFVPKNYTVSLFVQYRYSTSLYIEGCDRKVTIEYIRIIRPCKLDPFNPLCDEWTFPTLSFGRVHFRF